MGDLRISKDSGFIIGVAYNLHYGFDFGDDIYIRTATGVGLQAFGLHHAERAKRVRKDFKDLAESGVKVVSVKLFTDGRTGIDFDPKDRGKALKLQDTVLDGLDNLMAAAKESGIYVQLVFFDHTFLQQAEKLDKSAPVTSGVSNLELPSPVRGGQPSSGGTGLPKSNPTISVDKQGHAGAFTNRANREALFENVIKPVLEHLRRNPNLLSAELVNEPDSVLFKKDKKDHAVILDGQKEFFLRFRQEVISLTGAQFSVSAINMYNLSAWHGVIDEQQDFVSVHYFHRDSNQDPKLNDLFGPTSPITELQRSGVPVVFGEFAANGYGNERKKAGPQGNVDGEAFLELLRTHGVKGGIAWQMYDGRGTVDQDGNPTGESKDESLGAENFGQVPLKEFRHFHDLHAKEMAVAGPPLILETRSFGSQAGSDNRGFSLAPEASARIREKVALYPSSAAFSDHEVSINQIPSGRSTIKPSPPGVSRVDYGAAYQFHSGPGIDNEATITVTNPIPGQLKITMDFQGGKSLASEAILRDRAGNALFLGGFMPQNGTTQNPKGQITLRIALDASRNFVGVLSAVLSGSLAAPGNTMDGNKKYSIAGWNRALMPALTPANMPQAQIPAADAAKLNRKAPEKTPTKEHGQEKGGMGR